MLAKILKLELPRSNRFIYLKPFNYNSFFVELTRRPFFGQATKLLQQPVLAQLKLAKIKLNFKNIKNQSFPQPINPRNVMQQRMRKV